MTSLSTQFESLNVRSPLQASIGLDHSQAATSHPSEHDETDHDQDDGIDVQSMTTLPADGDPTGEFSDGTRGKLLLSREFHVTDLSLDYPIIAGANMWTRKDIKEFKDSVRKEKDAVIKIGSGETVTVRFHSHCNEMRTVCHLGSRANTRGWSLYLLGILHGLL
jgi:hypothetical protein